VMAMGQRQRLTQKVNTLLSVAAFFLISVCTPVCTRQLYATGCGGVKSALRVCAKLEQLCGCFYALQAPSLVWYPHLITPNPHLIHCVTVVATAVSMPCRHRYVFE
jgi:hypothetical protein